MPLPLHADQGVNRRSYPGSKGQHIRRRRNRKDGWCGRGMIRLMVMLEGKILVFSVIFLVVVVVGVVQFHECGQSDRFVVSLHVVDEMMDEGTHFVEHAQATRTRRTGRQQLENEQEGKGGFHFNPQGKKFGSNAALLGIGRTCARSNASTFRPYPVRTEMS